jgi:hypothetical protein
MVEKLVFLMELHLARYEADMMATRMVERTDSLDWLLVLRLVLWVVLLAAQSEW